MLKIWQFRNECWSEHTAMMRRGWAWLPCSAALLCLGASPAPVPKPGSPAGAPVTAAWPQPKARYAMDVGTTTGLAGVAGRGAGVAMSLMFGGVDREAHELRLRLGSSQTTTGTPVADHFFQPAAKLGRSVPLVTPPSAQPKDEPGQMPRDWMLGQFRPRREERGNPGRPSSNGRSARQSW